jgi:hypothetical protein
MHTSRNSSRMDRIVSIRMDCLSALGHYRVSNGAVTVTWNRTSKTVPLAPDNDVSSVAEEVLRSIVDTALAKS